MTRLRKRPGRSSLFAVVLCCVPTVLFCQRVRIAELSLVGSGESKIAYATLAATVSRFDIVATDGVRDAGGLEKVLAVMDEGWEAVSSGGGGSFGFFYNERVQLVKELGAYPGKGQFLRPPTGARFRLTGTGFTFNVIVCDVMSGKDQNARSAEIVRLIDVYRYFEKLTGNRKCTILAGRFGREHEAALRSLVEGARGDVIAVRAKSFTATGGGGRILTSSELRPRIEDAGISSSPPHPAFVVLKGK